MTIGKRRAEGAEVSGKNCGSYFEVRERETRSPAPETRTRRAGWARCPGRVNRRSEEVRSFADLINQERD